MEETSRVDRKIPLQPVRINTGGHGYGPAAGSEKAEPENAGRIASLIRELARAFGREIDCRPDGNDLLIADKSGEFLRMPLQQAFRLIETVRTDLTPILDRRA